MRLNTTAAMVAATVVFVVTCASLLGLYALAPNKPDVTPLFAGIPGGIAAVVALAVAGVQRGHGKALKRITHQTNGVLTARIEDAVSRSVGTSVAREVPAALAALLEEHLSTTTTTTTTRKR